MGVTAASEPLHDKLHIYLIYGSRTYKDLILIISKDKTCLNSLDIEEFIRCLCSYYRGAFDLLISAC